MQVDPINPTLTAPGIKLSKLKYGQPLSTSAFQFNLRRYDWEARNPAAAHAELTAAEEAQASLAKRINKKVIAMFDKAEVRPSEPLI